MALTEAIIIEGYRKLKGEWGECKKCEIGCMAKHHVLYSGAYQSPVLFIGEGPGRDEDYHGQAFVGPAGRLLRRAIALSGFEPAKFSYTNLVACRPTDSLEGPNRAPTREEIFSCYARLIRATELVAPKALVLLGRTAEEWVPGSVIAGKTWLVLKHPAFILRNGGENGSMFREWSRSLSAFLMEVCKWPDR